MDLREDSMGYGYYVWTAVGGSSPKVNDSHAAPV